MQKTPLISIIVPCYNVEKYVTECLESILSQSYKNIEILLIDDGSTDNTKDTIKPFLEDKRVKYLYQKNKGLSEARNKGLDEMQGEYVCFIDSDDFVHHDYIKTLYENIIKYDADISICDLVYYTDGKYIPHGEKEKKNIIISNRMECMELINKDFRYIVAWNKLYKAFLFENLRFTPNKIHEDEFLAHHIFWKINKVVRLSDVLYYYRKTPGSIMNSSYTDNKLQNAIEAFNERLLFYKKHNLPYIKNIYHTKWFFIYHKGLIEFNLLLAKKYILTHPLEFLFKLKGISKKKKIKIYLKLSKEYL